MGAPLNPKRATATRIACCLLLIALMFLTAGLVRAQGGSTVSGHVAGPGGVAVPGARIILFNTQTRQRKETWSDAAGNYAFRNVAPGTYRVVVMLVGFRPQLLGPIQVTAGRSEKTDATLALAQPGEPSGFGGFRRRGGAGGPPGAQMGRAGVRGQNGQRGQMARGASRGLGNEGAAASQGEPGELSDIVGAGGGLAGEGSAGAGLRFSGEETGTSEPSMGAEGAEGADLGGGAAASENSFLLAGNVVNATAPAEQRRGGRRFFMFGGGPGGPGGGPPGAPGFGGGGGQVMFFGAFRRPRVNRLRGSIFDNYSNSALNARPYPLNTPSQPQIPYYNELIGGSLGGPLSIPRIYRNGGNKTSFFANFVMSRAKSPWSLFDTVPTEAQRAGDFSGTLIQSGALAGTTPAIYEPSSSLGPRTPFPGNVIPSAMINPAAKGLLNYVPLPNLPGEYQNLHLQGSLPSRTYVAMGRIGQQFSAKDNLAVMYFYTSSLRNSINNFPALTSTASGRNQNVNVLESHTFSPHVVNMLTANFNRSRNDLLNPFAFQQNIAGELGIQGISQDPRNWGIPAIDFTNFTGLNDTIPSLTRNQTFRFSDFLIVNRGNHNLHAGGEFRKIQLNSIVDPDARGTFSFTGYSTSNFSPAGTPVNGTGYDFADFLLGLPQTTSERFGTSANYLRSSAYDVYGNDDWRVFQHLTLDMGLRWEYDAPFTEKYGHLADLALAPGYAVTGVVTGASPDGLPSSLLHGHPDNIAPRFGLAYRPWIAHSLVVRAGYGIFYDESIYSMIVNNMVSQPPFATTNTLVASPALPLTLQNGFPSVGSNVTKNTYAVDPNFLTPYAQSWNVMLEQDLGQNFVLTAAYIGTHGTHLNLLLAPNVSTTGGQGQTLVSNAQPFIYDTSGAASSYNGLRIGLRRFSHNGFSFFANYTYSKSMDDAASVGGTSSTRGVRIILGGLGGASSSNAAGGSSLGAVVQNPFDLHDEWGLSSFNPTQSLRFFTRYQLPFGDRQRFLSHGGALSKALSNWHLMDITSYSSGLPYTAFISGNLSNNVNGSAPFNNLRANATGQPVLPSGFVQTPLLFFNPAAFTLPAPGQYGTAGRNTIPGPSSLNFTSSLDRLVFLSSDKSRSLDFRISASNIFNLVNYNSIATTVNASGFGRVTGVSAMRTLNFSVRYRF